MLPRKTRAQTTVILLFAATLATAGLAPTTQAVLPPTGTYDFDCVHDLSPLIPPKSAGCPDSSTGTMYPGGQVVSFQTDASTAGVGTPGCIQVTDVTGGGTTWSRSMYKDMDIADPLATPPDTQSEWAWTDVSGVAVYGYTMPAAVPNTHQVLLMRWYNGACLPGTTDEPRVSWPVIIAPAGGGGGPVVPNPLCIPTGPGVPIPGMGTLIAVCVGDPPWDPDCTGGWLVFDDGTIVYTLVCDDDDGGKEVCHGTRHDKQHTSASSGVGTERCIGDPPGDPECPEVYFASYKYDEPSSAPETRYDVVVTYPVGGGLNDAADEVHPQISDTCPQT